MFHINSHYLTYLQHSFSDVTRHSQISTLQLFFLSKYRMFKCIGRCYIHLCSWKILKFIKWKYTGFSLINPLAVFVLYTINGEQPCISFRSEWTLQRLHLLMRRSDIYTLQVCPQDSDQTGRMAMGISASADERLTWIDEEEQSTGLDLKQKNASYQDNFASLKTGGDYTKLNRAQTNFNHLQRKTLFPSETLLWQKRRKQSVCSVFWWFHEPGGDF